MTKIRLSDVLYSIDAFRDLINFLETLQGIAIDSQSVELRLVYRHIMRNIARIVSKDIEVEKYLNNRKNGSTQINKNSK
ncbi:hypothetical protein DRN75_04095 [Nanoarchaeota archaeon]|nr:MAG: hypothetical protein DRN75_04095 [Nanoarchaeota archaeon]